jgi:transcriptional regulator GlxA family with amidase domain
MQEHSAFDTRQVYGVASGIDARAAARWSVSRSLLAGVARAEMVIQANADAPLTTEALARAAGLSSRSLSRGFQRLKGYSPMTALRRTRLERVRADLLRGPAGGTVTEAAVRWGFLHLGRFSSLYAARFGELPSATRRRALTLGSQSLQHQPAALRAAS